MNAFSILLVAATISLPGDHALGSPQTAASSIVDPWAAFLGCWQAPAESSGVAENQAARITCVIPVEGDPLSAEFVEFENGAETGRSRIRADGTIGAFAAGECSGRESARFSADGARVFLRGELTCADRPTERIAAIYSISAAGQLLHVRGRDDDADPRVSFRSLEAVELDGVPLALRGSLSEVAPASAARRAELSRYALDADVVSGAARSAPAAVVEIWIAATILAGADAPVMTNALRNALRGDDVPSRIVAVLEAFAEPTKYAVIYSPDGADVIRLQSVAGGGTRASSTIGVAQPASGRERPTLRCLDLFMEASAQWPNDLSVGRAQVLEVYCPGLLNHWKVLRATAASRGSPERTGEPAPASTPIHPVPERAAPILDGVPQKPRTAEPTPVPAGREIPAAPKPAEPPPQPVRRPDA